MEALEIARAPVAAASASRLSSRSEASRRRTSDLGFVEAAVGGSSAVGVPSRLVEFRKLLVAAR